jgi:hypothetical protein
MGAFFEHHDPRPDERAIRSLSERSGVSLGEVRTLVGDEFARLKMGAKVGSYLGVLTASNVRGMLRRKARLATDVPRPMPPKESDAARTAPEPSTSFSDPDRFIGGGGSRLRNGRFDKKAPLPHLYRWEDDGGSVRGAH